jgi:hypothetical protein
MASCDEGPMDLFVEQGNMVTENRSLPFFHVVKIDDVFDVQLMNDSVFGIEILAGKNIMPKITTVVRDSTLFISNEIRARWSRGYEKPELRVYFPSIRSLYIREPSNVFTVDTLACDNLIIYALADLQQVALTIKSWNFQFRSSHTASGVYVIRGRTWNSFLSAYAGCIIDAGDLETSYTTFVSHSIGDFTVNVGKALEGEIFNAGNVLYKGNPDIVQVERYSSGKAIKIN